MLLSCLLGFVCNFISWRLFFFHFMEIVFFSFDGDRFLVKLYISLE